VPHQSFEPSKLSNHHHLLLPKALFQHFGNLLQGRALLVLGNEVLDHLLQVLQCLVRLLPNNFPDNVEELLSGLLTCLLSSLLQFTRKLPEACLLARLLARKLQVPHQSFEPSFLSKHHHFMLFENVLEESACPLFLFHDMFEELVCSLLLMEHVLEDGMHLFHNLFCGLFPCNLFDVVVEEVAEESLLACLLACLFACLFACLLACLLACLFTCLFTCKLVESVLLAKHCHHLFLPPKLPSKFACKLLPCLFPCKLAGLLAGLLARKLLACLFQVLENVSLDAFEQFFLHSLGLFGQVHFNLLLC